MASINQGNNRSSCGPSIKVGEESMVELPQHRIALGEALNAGQATGASVPGNAEHDFQPGGAIQRGAQAVGDRQAVRVARCP